ncbi:MAG: class II glutamine amidotransferase [Thermodesulfobacteriota bacterium]
MCELFAMSAGYHYTAQEYLPLFADKARDNMSGWGIGFFREGQVHIEKSCEGIYSGGHVHDSFQRLARVIGSRIIISHIRCPKAGHQQESLAQPLTDFFLDHHWLFSFTGEAERVHAYDSPRPLMRDRLLAARVFEFIRDGVEEHTAAFPGHSLYQGLSETCQKLISQYPGKYAFFLANETVLFAFLNHGEVLTYYPPGNRGESLLLTTVSGGLTRDPELWHGYPNTDPNHGQILIISGADLLHLGHI